MSLFSSFANSTLQVYLLKSSFHEFMLILPLRALAHACLDCLVQEQDCQKVFQLTTNSMRPKERPHDCRGAQKNRSVLPSVSVGAARKVVGNREQ